MLNRSLLRRSLKSVIFVAVLLVAATGAYSQTKLLRFPDIYGDRIVFTYASDLTLLGATLVPHDVLRRGC